MKRTIILSFTSLFIMSLGLSLQIKANIGQSLFNALALLLAQRFNLQIGTILNILNFSIFVLYISLKKFKFQKRDVLQFIAIYLNGLFINLWVYHILSFIIIDNRIARVLLFILGIILSASSLGKLLSLNLVRFPLESLCLELAQRFNKNLRQVRFRFDLCFLTLNLALPLLFQVSFQIREGTLISFILFSALLGKSYQYFTEKPLEVH